MFYTAFLKVNLVKCFVILYCITHTWNSLHLSEWIQLGLEKKSLKWDFIGSGQGKLYSLRITK